MGRHIIHGFLSATVLYQCKWCERMETIILRAGDEFVNFGQLDGWREYRPDCRSGMDLCSSDCEKERDEAINAAYNNLEPVPSGSGCEPKGLWDEVNRLRVIKLRERR